MISCGTNDSKYWALIKEMEWIRDPSVELLNGSALAYTSESIKSQIPGEPQLATKSPTGMCVLTSHNCLPYPGSLN